MDLHDVAPVAAEHRQPVLSQHQAMDFGEDGDLVGGQPGGIPLHQYPPEQRDRIRETGILCRRHRLQAFQFSRCHPRLDGGWNIVENPAHLLDSALVVRDATVDMGQAADQAAKEFIMGIVDGGAGMHARRFDVTGIERPDGALHRQHGLVHGRTAAIFKERVGDKGRFGHLIGGVNHALASAGKMIPVLRWQFCQQEGNSLVQGVFVETVPVGHDAPGSIRS